MRSKTLPRFTSPDGKHTVETSNPAEGVQLRAAGYAESKARTATGKQADKAAEAPTK